MQETLKLQEQKKIAISLTLQAPATKKLWLKISVFQNKPLCFKVAFGVIFHAEFFMKALKAHTAAISQLFSVTMAASRRSQQVLETVKKLSKLSLLSS